MITPIFYWKFSGEVFVKDFPNKPNTVMHVEAQYHATDGVNDVARGIVIDFVEPTGPDFKSFDDLTTDNVVAWLDAAAPIDQMNAHRLLMTAELEALTMPHVWERGLAKREVAKPPAPPAQG